MRRTFRHIRKTLAHAVPPVLQEVNFAFDKGKYGRFGEFFEQIAEKLRGARNVRIAEIPCGGKLVFRNRSSFYFHSQPNHVNHPD